MICVACHSDNTTIRTTKFDQEKWRLKDGNDYLYRAYMVEDIVYNDTIRNVDQKRIIHLLGEPDYIKEEHYYYRISETRIANWPLKTKTMVIRFKIDKSIDWIKIHG